MRSLAWLVISTALAAALTGAGPARAQARTHTVARGDTLWDLAEAHGCTVAQLREANALERGDALVIGRTITIPDCGGAPPSPVRPREHVVAAGDTLAQIAARYETEVAELRRLNGLDDSLIRVGQRLKLPPPPAPKTGQSRGRVDAGSLAAPDRLPESPAYHIRRPPRTFATAHLIRQATRAIAAVEQSGLANHVLAVGDLSDEDGGPLTGHRTHQSGRDVDLGFYFVRAPDGYPDNFVEATADNLDAAATWALVEQFVLSADEPGGVELIYLDYEVQKILYKAALRDGWTAEQLAGVFEYPDGRGAEGRIVRHRWNHLDHMHVRVRCPPGDARCE